MRATGNLEPAVGDVAVSPQGKNRSENTTAQQGSMSDSEVESTITTGTAQQGVMAPHGIPGRVVYVSNHNTGEDTRVINVLQGREFNGTTNVLQGEMHFQNKMQEPDKFIQNSIAEKVVYVPSKESISGGQGNFVLDAQVTNDASGRVVYLQQNVINDNVNAQDSTMDQTNGPNNTQENIKYIQLNDNTFKVVGSDSNQMPIRVMYLPQQMPEGSGNTQMVPAVTIHAPNDMHLVQYMPPRTPSPSRTPSPNKTQERVLQVAGQVLNMAGKAMKQHSQEENKTQERIVYVGQPQVDQASHSQYMMPQMQYLGSSMPQIAYQGGSMPPFAYQGGYMTQMPNQGGFMPQQMLQREAFIPQMYQPVLMQPSPHLVQDGMYMASPSSSVPTEGLSLLSQPAEAASPSSGLDFLDSNAADDNCCCSWFDCFISCCGCCSE